MIEVNKRNNKHTEEGMGGKRKDEKEEVEDKGRKENVNEEGREKNEWPKNSRTKNTRIRRTEGTNERRGDKLHERGKRNTE